MTRYLIVNRLITILNVHDCGPTLDSLFSHERAKILNITDHLPQPSSDMQTNIDLAILLCFVLLQMITHINPPLFILATQNRNDGRRYDCDLWHNPEEALKANLVGTASPHCGLIAM